GELHGGGARATFLCSHGYGFSSDPPVGGSGLGSGLTGATAGGLGCGAVGIDSCRGGLPTPVSTCAFLSIVTSDSAEPLTRNPVGTTFVVELTNGVVLLRPAPMSTSRRLDGRLGIAARPIAMPSA